MYGGQDSRGCPDPSQAASCVIRKLHEVQGNFDKINLLNNFRSGVFLDAILTCLGVIYTKDLIIVLLLQMMGGLKGWEDD